MLPRLITTIAACGALTLVAGCGDSDGADPTRQPDATSGPDADAGPIPTRPLYGGRAEAYDLSSSRPWQPAFEGTPDGLTEIVVVPLDAIGIPWASFTGPDNRPGDLPGPWLTRFNAIKAAAEATGEPIALALTPLSRAGDTLAPAARDEQGALILNDTWRPYCYNPAEDGNPTGWRDAYAGFVVWAVRQLAPEWVILGQRMNLYEANCGVAAYTAVADYPAEAHRRLQALADDGEVDVPTTIVGVDVEDLYGFPKRSGRCVVDTAAECFAKRAELLDVLTADLLGVESYPAFAVDGVDEVDAGWLTRPFDHRDDMGAAIIGTSFPAASLDERRQVGCAPIVQSDEADQRVWADQVIAAGDAHDAELVIWRSLVDLLDAEVVGTCPCTGDDAICQHFDQLGAAEANIKRLTAAGLVALDGTERSAAALWRQAMDADEE